MFLLKNGGSFVYFTIEGKPVLTHTEKDIYFEKEDIVVDPVGKLGRVNRSHLIQDFAFRDYDRRMCKEGYYGFTYSSRKVIFIHANDIEYLD